MGAGSVSEIVRRAGRGCFKGELVSEPIDHHRLPSRMLMPVLNGGLIGHKRGHRKDKCAIWMEHE